MLMSQRLWRVALLLLLAWCGSAAAAIIHIDFRYGITDFQTAVGYADFDADRLMHPGGAYVTIPVLRLYMVITGTDADGVYTERDLPWLNYETYNDPLDFTRELVGQDTPNCPNSWGDSCGDFSFDGRNDRGVAASAHNGLMVPGAIDNYLKLISAVPRLIPEPASPALGGLALLVMWGVRRSAPAGSRRA